MRNRRWFFPGVFGLVLAAGAVPITGCGSDTPAQTAMNPPVDDEASQDLAEHQRHHHHGGVTMFIALSLDSLGEVTDAQKAAIESIRKTLFEKMEPGREANAALVAAIADGFSSGTLDKDKIHAAIEQVKVASGSIHDATADALNQLHATLDAAQRVALVHKVEAHWAFWERVHQVDGKPITEGHPYHRRVEHLAKELALTPEQIEKVKEATAAERIQASMGLPFDHETVHRHVMAFVAAFESDSFDAKALQGANPANSHLAHWGAARMAHFYEALDPILNADQKTKLAGMLKTHAE